MEKLPAGSSDGTLGSACLLYKEGDHEGARKLFTTALDALGYQPELAYNIALCYYQVKQYGPALKHIAEIIERGVREHPELSVGAAADGAGVRSVGNSQVRIYKALLPLLRVWPHALDNSLKQIILQNKVALQSSMPVCVACGVQCTRMRVLSPALPLETLSVYTCTDLMGTVCAVPPSVQQVLKESALVEAFNLKAAIEYNMKNYEAAREAMTDAPPRTEEELDPVRTAPLHSCHSN